MSVSRGCLTWHVEYSVASAVHAVPRRAEVGQGGRRARGGIKAVGAILVAILAPQPTSPSSSHSLAGLRAGDCQRHSDTPWHPDRRDQVRAQPLSPPRPRSSSPTPTHSR